MQEVLPVGLALADRVRKGGPAEVVAAFEGRRGDPLDALRQEGEPAASRVRAQLDQLSPGLGNPVVPVQVRDIPQEEAWDPEPAVLPERLRQITARLDALERRLQADG